MKKTRKNILILTLVVIGLPIFFYAIYLNFFQYPKIKNHTYFHCSENSKEWPQLRLENFEMYDVRVKENQNLYFTIVKFYEDREFLTQKVWYGAPSMSLFQRGSNASFAFDTDKYIVLNIPVNGESKPPDYFVLNRFNLTAQIITQNFLTTEKKKLSLGNRNKLNEEIDELVKKIFERNSKIPKQWGVPVQIQCMKVSKPTKKI